MTQAHVIVYSRPGCHLCDEMKEVIRSAGCNELYTFDEINIDNDPMVRERYKFDIPVLTINGVESFMHRVTKEEFVAAIRSVYGKSQ